MTPIQRIEMLLPILRAVQIPIAREFPNSAAAVGMVVEELRELLAEMKAAEAPKP